jgi:hypothetical protein
MHFLSQAVIMRFLVYTTILAATIPLGRTTAEIFDPWSTLFIREDSQTPVLRAVTVRSDLERRGVDFTPKRTCEHHYADRIYPPSAIAFYNSNGFASRCVFTPRRECAIRHDFYEVQAPSSRIGRYREPFGEHRMSGLSHFPRVCG